ncbi:alginate lyase family protein [Rhizophagus clarus]|uniref:Alginate lyase family protein n=1 Tax=Rhizophagus clarus TaxID=94130 RepID=A0A8H3QAH1_9GLOM|nr:alginate lyase family protein [Rhizophagus clarus]
MKNIPFFTILIITSLCIIIAQALKALKNNQPYSVINTTVIPPNNNKQEYISYAPYFWPFCDGINVTDPETQCFYKRINGKVNCDAKIPSDPNDSTSMVRDVLSLSISYQLYNCENFAKKAAFYVVLPTRLQSTNARAWDRGRSYNQFNCHYQLTFVDGESINAINNGGGTFVIKSSKKRNQDKEEHQYQTKECKIDEFFPPTSQSNQTLKIDHNNDVTLESYLMRYNIIDITRSSATEARSLLKDNWEDIIDTIEKFSNSDRKIHLYGTTAQYL